MNGWLEFVLIIGNCSAALLSTIVSPEVCTKETVIVFILFFKLQLVP